MVDTPFFAKYKPLCESATTGNPEGNDASFESPYTYVATWNWNENGWGTIIEVATPTLWKKERFQQNGLGSFQIEAISIFI